MKNLSTYISGTLITDYIAEARTLKDLKGKRVGKIEVSGNSGTLKWQKAASYLDNAIVKDIEELNAFDMAEIYSHCSRHRIVDIITYYGVTKITIGLVVSDDEKSMRIGVFRDKEVEPSISIKNNEKEFIRFLSNYINRYILNLPF